MTHSKGESPHCPRRASEQSAADWLVRRTFMVTQKVHPEHKIHRERKLTEEIKTYPRGPAPKGQESRGN